MRPRSWHGQLHLWGGRALYVGPAFNTAMHTHHAVQVCVAIDGSFRLRTKPAGTWSAYRGAVISSDQLHQLNGQGNTLAIMYLDPEVHAGRRLMRQSARTAVCSISDAALKRVIERLQEPVQPGGEVCDAMVEVVAPGGGPTAPLDDRVARALALLRDAPDQYVRLGQLAAAVAISPSRLAHLFRAHVGLPVRRYRLWLRLGDALREVKNGASLTAAAHAAGFADSAHFSRTFRRMLGISPSALDAE